MMTKKEYCASIVTKYLNNNSDLELDMLESEVYNSSSLAVAMEYLGMITNTDILDYTSTRAGIVAMYYNKDKGETSTLTVRDLISLLPDDKPVVKKSSIDDKIEPILKDCTKPMLKDCIIGMEAFGGGAGSADRWTQIDPSKEL